MTYRSQCLWLVPEIVPNESCYNNHPLDLETSARPPAKEKATIISYIQHLLREIARSVLTQPCHPLVKSPFWPSRLLVRSPLSAWSSLSQVPSLDLAFSWSDSSSAWAWCQLGSIAPAILIDPYPLVTYVANRIVVGKFMGGNIFRGSVALT